MTKYEDFVQRELQGRLAPGEPIVHMAFLSNKSLAGMVLSGGLLGAALSRSTLEDGYFLAAATDRRLLLIKIKPGLFSFKRENQGIVELPYQDIANIEPGGALNQRTVKFIMRDGSTLPFRLNTLAKLTAGQKTFVASLPGYVAAWNGQRRSA